MMILRLISIMALLWAGMILGVSLESWAKFRAPLLTKKVGLDVGRSVFNYFHKIQILWLLLIALPGIFAPLSWSNWLIIGTLIAIFLLQTCWLFPLLTQQVNEIISDKPSTHAHTHTLYGIGELAKLLLLLGLSIKILTCF